MEPPFAGLKLKVILHVVRSFSKPPPRETKSWLCWSLRSRCPPWIVAHRNLCNGRITREVCKALLRATGGRVNREDGRAPQRPCRDPYLLRIGFASPRARAGAPHHWEGGRSTHTFGPGGRAGGGREGADGGTTPVPLARVEEQRGGKQLWDPALLKTGAAKPPRRCAPHPPARVPQTFQNWPTKNSGPEINRQKISDAHRIGWQESPKEMQKGTGMHRLHDLHP